MIARTNELVLFLLASLVFLATTEVGYRLGLRQKDRQDEESRKHIGSLQAALLGLLALLLGFNFAMASSRYDSRRALLQEEVTAIGTAYLRARILLTGSCRVRLGINQLSQHPDSIHAGGCR